MEINTSKELMRVTRIEGPSTEDDVRRMYYSFRTCYDPNVGTLLRGEKDSPSFETMVKFIQERIKEGHLSPVEHVTRSFLIENVSRALTHQLVRHRLASYTQASQRYIGTSGDVMFLVPNTVNNHENPDVRKSYIECLQKTIDTYKFLQEQGVPNEDARFLLPNATPSNIVVTKNLRSWLHFFSERSCNRAQWEIRAMAREIYKHLSEDFPFIFDPNKTGAKCEKLGFCPESRGCGRYPMQEEV